MKVSEAKEKVCPFIEDAFWIDARGMRSNTAINITCICGDCMAWSYTEEFKLVDELCISFTDGKMDKSSYEIAQQITPSHYKINGNKSATMDCRVGYETWARKIEIAEHEKSGYCVRIGQK